jgi:hypothetical protein
VCFVVRACPRMCLCVRVYVSGFTCLCSSTSASLTKLRSCPPPTLLGLCFSSKALTRCVACVSVCVGGGGEEGGWGEWRREQRACLPCPPSPFWLQAQPPHVGWLAPGKHALWHSRMDLTPESLLPLLLLSREVEPQGFLGQAGVAEVVARRGVVVVVVVLAGVAVAAPVVAAPHRPPSTQVVRGRHPPPLAAAGAAYSRPPNRSRGWAQTLKACRQVFAAGAGGVAVGTTEAFFFHPGKSCGRRVPSRAPCDGECAVPDVTASPSALRRADVRGPCRAKAVRPPLPPHHQPSWPGHAAFFHKPVALVGSRRDWPALQARV